MAPRSLPPPADTESRLIETALVLFGRHGRDGTSTRAIAAAAGTPMSAITYHFGGKDALYLAVARHIATSVRMRMAPILEVSLRLRGEDGDPASAREALLAIFEGFVTMLVHRETAHWARFIVREQADPTEAFDIVYSEMMEPLLDHVLGLMLCVADGAIDEAEARVRVMALAGQALGFRVARATALRVNHWADIGEVETGAIRAVIRAQTAAILDSLAARSRP